MPGPPFIADEGLLVGYFINNKAFRVYNSRTRKVEEDLHVNFFENKPNVIGSSPEWLFDIDSLTNSMKYQPVSTRNRTNGNVGLEINSDAGQAGKEKVSDQEYILLPLLNTCSDVPSSHDNKDGTFQRTNNEWDFLTPIIVNVVGSSFSHPAALDDFTKMPNLEDTRIFDNAYDNKDEGAEADYNNLETRDHRGIFVRNKARLAAQGHRQAEGIDYDEVFAFVARIEAIRLFLACASFMDFTAYQMNVKSVFLYGTVKEEVYVRQPPGFMDLEFPDRVVKSASTPMEIHKPLSKDADGTDVDVHLYRFQVQPKVSHMHAVKRIFRYLKGQPTLGLWYPKDSPLELIPYSDSDYVGASLDRKSTT
uniref:Retrovirus-related Pol polyprotein from transposon TNT 1-94 n=1 Tax=Tanacetum cinerariifolium TaxID=118510 RepID=A0A6L2MLD6_TANCI|nr:retrovirus-related Pol polyprotein from transposon TNT 1-94 [Tanacetum cinerariifolium]